MPAPLPKRNSRLDPFAGGANPGLVWNKFFDEWDKNEDPKQCRSGKKRSESERKDESEGPFSKPAGGPAKQAWIGKFTKGVGDENTLKAACRRVQALVIALGGKCEHCTTTAPFVTGMGLEHPVENGFTWHHTLGVPCLPASSVKGLVRAWAEHWLGVDAAEITRVFGGTGDREGAGSIIVFDALPTGPVTLMAEVLTPHDGGWRQGRAPAPSDWHSPVPIPFLVVAPGARFCFAVAPRPGAKSGSEDTGLFMGWLKEALDWIGAGAKTAVGFGRFESESARPLQVEDEVILTEDHGKSGKAGDTAKILAVFEEQVSAKIKLSRGGKGSEFVVPICKLKRP